MGKAQGFQRDRPFEHPAIIGTLRDEFFVGPNTIVNQYLGYFKRGQEHMHSLTASMVALAATAVSMGMVHILYLFRCVYSQVYASLKEWETGRFMPAHFTMNVYADIYRGHIEDLMDINR